MVSGMLTAIQDFVRDSVSGAEREDLETVRMGEVGVILVYGPRTRFSPVLCVALRRGGSAAFFRTLSIPSNNNEPRISVLSPATPRNSIPAARNSKPAWLVRAVLRSSVESVGGPRAPVRAAGVVGIRPRRVVDLFGRYPAPLDGFFTSTGERAGYRPDSRRAARIEVRRFRIADPFSVTRESAVLPPNLPGNKVEFHWEEYHSLTPSFAARRQIVELKDELEKQALRFATGTSRKITPEQQMLLEGAGSKMLAIIQAAATLGKTVRIQVRGNHDPIGSEAFNSGLARTRAENVRATLVAWGVPASAS